MFEIDMDEADARLLEADVAHQRVAVRVQAAERRLGPLRGDDGDDVDVMEQQQRLIACLSRDQCGMPFDVRRNFQLGNKQPVNAKKCVADGEHDFYIAIS